jgi:nucleoid DNA-binding protein
VEREKPPFGNGSVVTYSLKSMKVKIQTLTARISERTGLTSYKSRKALKMTLWLIRRALGDGKQVELGDELGKLKVVARKLSRRINRNLKHRAGTIENVYKHHPKTVRLLGGKDMSENPQPTIVHKAPQPTVAVPARRRVAIALPSWRRRIVR